MAPPLPPAPKGGACSASSKQVGAELSPYGATVKTIVFVGLGGGAVCGNTRDWRSNLPRYMGKYTQANVILFFPREQRCTICWTPEKDLRRSCSHLITKGVDLLVIIGSGKQQLAQHRCEKGAPWCPYQFSDLSAIMRNEWAVKAERTVHFPIRNVGTILENRLFKFDAMIDDGSFVKPAGECTARVLSQCYDKPKQKNLLYIGRMLNHKGQLAFLRAADPESLRGYTVQFFGNCGWRASKLYMRKMRSVAEAKGISIKIYGEVSKSQLLTQMCKAKGLIMMSVDKNPRAVYEAVQAGIPVFVSSEAQVRGGRGAARRRASHALPHLLRTPVSKGCKVRV